MTFLHLILVILPCFSVASHQIYTCLDRVNTVRGGAYLFSPNFPATITDRRSCFFNFSEPGNYVLYFTGGTIRNFRITINSTYKIEKEKYNYYDDFLEYVGRTIAFELLDQDEPDDQWEAFQLYIYNNLDNPNCEKPFYETFDDLEENGYPLSLGLGPSVCFFRNTTGEFNFNYTIFITTPDVSAFKVAYKVNLTNEDSLYAFNEEYTLTIENIKRWFFPDMNYYYTGYSFPQVDEIRFQLISTISPPVTGNMVNCSLIPTSDHSWQLSNYNLTRGYPKNSQCMTRIEPKPGYRLFMSFIEYSIEPFDFVVVQSIMDLTIVSVSKYSLVVFPEAPALFEFNSDVNIQYAGFTMNITEYDCRCYEKTYTIPCDGPFIKYYSDGIDNEHAFCETTCSFNVIVNETCRDWFPYATAAPPPLYAADGSQNNFPVFSIVNNVQTSIIGAGKFIFKLDDNPTFMYENQGHFSYPIDTNMRSFTIIFEATETPNVNGTMLTESNPDIIYNLHSFSRNTFSITTASGVVELFVVAEDITYLCDFAIYAPDRKTYIQPFCSIPNNSISYMPPVYSANGSIPIYVTQHINNSHSFAYFRTPEITTKNCMFKHNVIDVIRIVDTDTQLTMVNNGTGYCNTVLLNALNGTVFMKELWTDSRNDPVLFYIGDELQFEFTKDTAINFEGTELQFGKQHFALPARKSFSVFLRTY